MEENGDKRLRLKLGGKLSKYLITETYRNYTTFKQTKSGGCGSVQYWPESIRYIKYLMRLNG